jgi:hypothetical protein
VSEEYDRVLFEVLPHPIQVLDVRTQRHVIGLHLIGRSPATALVVVDQAQDVAEPIRVGQQVAVVEIGPAVKDEHRLPLPDGAEVERALADTNAALARLGAALVASRVWRFPRRPRNDGDGDNGRDQARAHGFTSR